MKEIFLSNLPAAIASVGLICYFTGMFFVFVCSPVKHAEKFAIRPIDNAGKTEIRVYYGGISGALAGFLAYLTFVLGNPGAALVGGLFFATTVFVTRTVFLFVDKGWGCPYTKLAIPAEGLFVVALWGCFILSKVV